jgi:hypothetical protein
MQSSLRIDAEQCARRLPSCVFVGMRRSEDAVVARLRRRGLSGPGAHVPGIFIASPTAIIAFRCGVPG